MKRILIITGILLFIFLFLLLILYFLIKSFLTEERIRKFSEDKIREATGLLCKIEKVSPYIGIKGVGIDIKNLKLYKEKEIAFSERIFFKVKLIPIIFKKIEIDKIYIEKPFFEYKIKKEKIEKVKRKEGEEKEFEIPFIFFLKNLEIKDGKFKICDDEKIEISNFNLILKGILNKNILEIKGENDFEIKIRNFNFPLKDKFKINFDLKNDLANVENFSIYFLKNELNLNGNIKGIISGETEYDVYLSSDKFNLQNLPEILKELKIFGILKIDLNLKGNKNKGKIRAKFFSGKNDLNIDADLNFDKKIEIYGNISSFYFNLDEILKEEEKKEGKREIPFLLPPNLKIDINCFIKEFSQKNNVLKNVRFRLKGDENNIRIENFKGEAFEGVKELEKLKKKLRR
jgi:hypothetical protein